MPKQDLPETIELARSLVKQHGNHNDAVYHLCQTARMEWPEAEALVRRVEAADAQRPAQGGQANITSAQRVRAVIFLLCVVLLVATPVCGLVQYWQWHTPSEPIVRNFILWPETIYPGTLLHSTRGRRYERARWAEAGQIIVVHYDVTPATGWLTITVDKVASLLCSVSQQEQAAFQRRTAITQRDQGKLEIPVADSCLYRLSVGLYAFMGQLNISWEIK